jgi:hypothetical protein
VHGDRQLSRLRAWLEDGSGISVPKGHFGAGNFARDGSRRH